MGLTFHRLIQRDPRNVLTYYEEEGGPVLSGRFYQEFETVVRRIEQNPRRFHLVSEVLRRANFPSFPFHLLFRESEEGIEFWCFGITGESRITVPSASEQKTEPKVASRVLSTPRQHNPLASFYTRRPISLRRRFRRKRPYPGRAASPGQPGFMTLCIEGLPT